MKNRHLYPNSSIGLLGFQSYGGWLRGTRSGLGLKVLRFPFFDSQQLWLACHLRETFFEHAAPSTHSDGHPQMPSPSLALFRGSSDALWHWRPHLMHWSGWTDTSCAPQVLQLPGLPPRSVCRCETAKLGPLLGCPVVEGRSERSRASLTPKPFSKRRRPSNEPQLATIPLLPDPG